MRRISYNSLAFVVMAVGLLASAAAFAQDGRTCPGNTPNPNSAVVQTRFWNDCPTSIVTVGNNYPAWVVIDDAVLDCFGYANKHIWHLSEDGVNRAMFENCSHYRFGATVMLTGTGGGEGGLLLSPWWGPGDGQFMINANTGEIACFGGRLPFYTFTGGHGLHYVKGTPIYMEITYNPRQLSAAFPAQIRYSVIYGGNYYTSGYLNFDQGNAGEDPPHGLWGELVPAWVGGYVQPYLGNGNDVNFRGWFQNIVFEGPTATPAAQTTWGKLKSIYR